MKKRYILLIFAFLLVLISPDKVFARNAIATATAPGISPDSEPMGKIILYDDYKVAFHYEYRVNNIIIEVCKDSVCKNLKEAENQTFTANTMVEFDLNPLLIKEENKSSEYTIKATASFRQTEGLGFESVATLTTKVNVKASNQKENASDEVLGSTSKVLTFVNDWIIPGIYVLLAVVLLVKGILLAVDLVKYSDNGEVRKEKLKAFAYMFVGVVCVAIINSTAGIITGLFR